MAPFPLSAVASLAGTYKRVEIPENSRFKAAARTEQEDDDLIGTDSTVSGENNSSFTVEERLQSERREGQEEEEVGMALGSESERAVIAWQPS